MSGARHARLTENTLLSPKRRQPRRRNRADERPSGPAIEPEPGRQPRDISWTGLIGGLTGAIPAGASGVEILIAPEDVSRVWSIPFFAISIVYLPAIWASVSPVKNRQRILRNVLSLSLVTLVITTLVTSDPRLAVLLLLPSTLLAIASGVIFQGPRARH